MLAVVLSFSGVAVCMASACFMAWCDHECLAAWSVVVAALCMPSINVKDYKRKE